jgi:hypothetical protein
MTSFSPEVQTAVLAHMNGDHNDDNLLIVRAFSQAAATSAEMTGFDEAGGIWSAVLADGPAEVRVAWPAGPISERAEVRREIVALYDEACERLGVEPRPH